MSDNYLHQETESKEQRSEALIEAPSATQLHPSATPSLEDAKRFLDALAPTGIVTVQCLPERESNGARTGANLTRHDPKLSSLLNHNRKGAGVFVMVNEGNGIDRKAAAVQRIRAVFVDLDGAKLQPVLDAPIPPSIVVESSPGRYHAYWLLRNMPLEDFKRAQQVLAAMFNGDKSVNDLPRLMRIPGFLHHKNSAPFCSRLLRCEPELVWEWTDLATGLDLPMSMRLPKQIAEGGRNTTLFRMAGNAAMTGTSKSACLADMVRINEERCIPPLSSAEVAGIVESAYRNPPSGVLRIPLSLFRNDQFVSLDIGSKLLLLLTYQRIANKPKNSEIALLWKDFKQHFPRAATFCDYRAKLVKRSFLSRQREQKRRIDDGKPDYNLYKLAITTGI